MALQELSFLVNKKHYEQNVTEIHGATLGGS